MNIDAKEVPHIVDYNSIGWLNIYRSLDAMLSDRPDIQQVLHTARIGFDLGSDIGQSAFALNKLCPNLRVLVCVDKSKPLQSPFKEKLADIVKEKRQTMQRYVRTVASRGNPLADVIMLASSNGQPFFNAEDFYHLANSIRQGGIFFEVNPDFDSSYNQIPMRNFFNLIAEGYHRTIWQRNDAIAPKI